MRSLGSFQDALGDALRGDVGAIAPWLATSLSDTPGLSVYRNTVTRGSVDVLVATFSTVVRMVGEDWFRAAAAIYVADRPPSTPSLLSYGEDFPDWLSTFPQAQDTPYLSAIACLDRLWWEAYFAAEADILDPEAVSRLDAEELESTTLRLHPSVRLAAFDHNLGSLWLKHRDDASPGEFEITDTAECVLIVRAGRQVESRIISPASHTFLAACQAEKSVMAAAGRALSIDQAASLPEIIGAHLAAGVLSSVAAARAESDHDH